MGFWLVGNKKELARVNLPTHCELERQGLLVMMLTPELLLSP
jgi:hypothetical protein